MPSIDPQDLIERYIGVWNEPDPRSAARPWTNSGLRTVLHVLRPPQQMRDTAVGLGFTTAVLEARGHDELHTRVTRAHDEFVAPGRCSRIQEPARTAAGRPHVPLGVLPHRAGWATGGGREFLVLDEDGRIRFDYQFVDLPRRALGLPRGEGAVERGGTARGVAVAIEQIEARGVAGADRRRGLGARASNALALYHFSTKEELVAAAFTYAAEDDLAHLRKLLGSSYVGAAQAARRRRRYARPARPRAGDCGSRAGRPPCASPRFRRSRVISTSSGRPRSPRRSRREWRPASSRARIPRVPPCG